VFEGVSDEKNEDTALTEEIEADETIDELDIII
jgi:hypothetical protein